MICGCVECNQRLDNNMENEDKAKEERKASIVIDWLRSNSSSTKAWTYANGLDQTVS